MLSLLKRVLKMKTLNIQISENEFLDYELNSENMSFSELKEKIKKKTIREALYSSQKIAEELGISDMTLEDINEEINYVRNRNAKNNP